MKFSYYIKIINILVTFVIQLIQFVKGGSVAIRDVYINWREIETVRDGERARKREGAVSFRL